MPAMPWVIVRFSAASLSAMSSTRSMPTASMKVASAPMQVMQTQAAAKACARAKAKVTAAYSTSPPNIARRLPQTAMILPVTRQKKMFEI